jgi:uncharacterized protein with GYD domain
VATFIMLARLAHGAIRSPEQLEKLEKEVMKRIEEGLAGGPVKWLANYAVLGPYDYLDIFEAPDIEAAMKVSAIVRTLGHAHTEVWAAAEWKRSRRSSAAYRGRRLSRRRSSAVAPTTDLRNGFPRFGFRETG